MRREVAIMSRASSVFALCARDSIRMQICSSRAKNVSSSRAFPSVACTCAMLVSENVGLAHEGRGDASAVGATAAALRLGLFDCRGDASCVAAEPAGDDRGIAASGALVAISGHHTSARWRPGEPHGVDREVRRC